MDFNCWPLLHNNILFVIQRNIHRSNDNPDIVIAVHRRGFCCVLVLRFSQWFHNTKKPFLNSLGWSRLALISKRINFRLELFFRDHPSYFVKGLLFKKNIRRWITVWKVGENLFLFIAFIYELMKSLFQLLCSLLLYFMEVSLSFFPVILRHCKWTLWQYVGHLVRGLTGSVLLLWILEKPWSF